MKPGTTVSYAQLAERAGLPRTAARAAGSACAQNLIAPFVPCHRVLPSTGRIRRLLLRHPGKGMAGGPRSGKTYGHDVTAVGNIPG